MKKITLIFLSLIAIVISGCSGSDDGPGPSGLATLDVTTISLTTKTPVLLPNNQTISTGGVASISLNGYINTELGICYSINPNPTLFDQVVVASSGSGAQFGCDFIYPQLGTTYYIRAYVKDTYTNLVKYGNQVTVATPNTLSTAIVKNIGANSFSVDVTVDNTLATNTIRGVFFGPNPNPGPGNGYAEDGTTGAGTFTVNYMSSGPNPSIVPNTNYYLRSFVFINGAYLYGNQVTFKSTGYIGGSGGYVFYDKGETTNGWRYLEAAPTFLTNPGIGDQFKWSCNNTFMPTISNNIGTGKENTQAIRNVCNFTNVGATMCSYLTLNGQNDWFSPSIEEIKYLYKLKTVGIINFTSTVLSSSQLSDTLAYALDFGTGNTSNISKSSTYYAWQVRRF